MMSNAEQLKDTMEENDLPTCEIKIAVVIPTYNNAATVVEIVRGVQQQVADVIVVNDGSTDNTTAMIGGLDSITVVSFDRNRGKGAALKAGFEKAAELGFSHVITIDSDGQHLTGDIPLFIDAIHLDPQALWIGSRELLYTPGEKQPARSRFGKAVGVFWYKFNTGIKLHDTQSGFRAYPLQQIRGLKCKGTRYEFEIEILTRAAWNGVAVKEVQVHLYYQSGDERVSHFRPIIDFLRISKINAKCAIIRMCLPVTVLEVPGATVREKFIALARHELKANASPQKAASSLSLGVFMGLFPIHFFQVITLLGLSLVLPINKPLALLGVSVSSAPFLPLIIVVAVAIGKLVVPANLVVLQGQKTAQTWAQGGIEFVAGSVILSIVAGITTYALSLPLFNYLQKLRNHKNRKPVQ